MNLCKNIIVIVAMVVNIQSNIISMDIPKKSISQNYWMDKEKVLFLADIKRKKSIGREKVDVLFKNRTTVPFYCFTTKSSISSPCACCKEQEEEQKKLQMAFLPSEQKELNRVENEVDSEDEEQDRSPLKGSEAIEVARNLMQGFGMTDENLRKAAKEAIYDVRRESPHINIIDDL